MHVVYTQKPLQSIPGIFLAGPSPRRDTHITIDSWRDTMCSELKGAGHTGTVYNPEPEFGRWDDHDFTKQVEWEYEALNKAAVILFWVPRDMRLGMPGLTTNVEFGYWIKSRKVILAYPDDAEHVKYLAWLYQKETKRFPVHSMREAALLAVERIHNTVGFEAAGGDMDCG